MKQIIIAIILIVTSITAQNTDQPPVIKDLNSLANLGFEWTEQGFRVIVDDSTWTLLSSIIANQTTLQGYVNELETKLDQLRDSISVLANQNRPLGKAILTGTATTTWTQLSSQACNGGILKNISNSGELRFAFSSSPGSNYDIINSQMGQEILVENANEVWIYGSSIDYKFYAK